MLSIQSMIVLLLGVFTGVVVRKPIRESKKRRNEYTGGLTFILLISCNPNIILLCIRSFVFCIHELYFCYLLYIGSNQHRVYMVHPFSYMHHEGGQHRGEIVPGKFILLLDDVPKGGKAANSFYTL